MNTCVVELADGSPCPNLPTVGNYCDSHQAVLSRDIDMLKMVESHHMQDVREFWARSNFYLVVDAALVSVFVQSSSSLRHLLGAFGVIISLFWLLVARGSVYWIKMWRDEVRRLDQVVDRFRIYDRVEQNASSRPYLSPSWVTQWLPAFFVVGWVVLLAKS